ncbi:MAG TPA: tyrosinase family protein [Xanthobacteraceae bacterium]|jgi:tyrosinase
MITICRRTLLQGSAAVGALSLANVWPVSATDPKTRYSAFSVEGRKALASYAKAVAVMHDRSRQDATDPLGWTYQYKMHWYPDDGDSLVLPDGGIDWARLERDQIAELDSFFGPPGTGNVKRSQAEATWGKCPHSNSSTIALDFMPWHRLYLFFFERIVRKLSGDDEFTLPYWGYMDAKASQVLPPGFDVAGSPLRHDRSPASNQGDPMSPSFFDGKFWSDPAFPVFTRAVEGTPHGVVHNFVGDGNRDMASLFQSPRDPVFWLHHCEIDRIWEGALKTGFKPPGGAWLNNTHSFFDENGVLVKATNNDALNTQQIKDWPGYLYHDVPAPPSGPVAAMQALNLESRPRHTLAVAENVSLHTGLQTNSLTAAPAMGTFAVNSLTAAGNRRVKLEISNVTLDRRAVANIALYLNAPADAKGEALRKYEVGVLSTFSILPGPTDLHAAHAPSGPPNVLSFDVTRLLTELQREGRWPDQLRLTTMEITGSLAGAELRLGKVELVETSTSGPLQ